MNCIHPTALKLFASVEMLWLTSLLSQGLTWLFSMYIDCYEIPSKHACIVPVIIYLYFLHIFDVNVSASITHHNKLRTVTLNCHLPRGWFLCTNLGLLSFWLFQSSCSHLKVTQACLSLVGCSVGWPKSFYLRLWACYPFLHDLNPYCMRHLWSELIQVWLSEWHKRDIFTTFFRTKMPNVERRSYWSFSRLCGLPINAEGLRPIMWCQLGFNEALVKAPHAKDQGSLREYVCVREKKEDEGGGWSSHFTCIAHYWNLRQIKCKANRFLYQ